MFKADSVEKVKKKILKKHEILKLVGINQKSISIEELVGFDWTLILPSI